MFGDLRFHRLLVPVDESAGSLLALAAAVRVAERDHATITLLTAVPAGPPIGWGAPWAPIVAGATETDACAFAERRLRAASSRIPQAVSVCLVVRRGKPGPVIVEEADPARYDAIIMGSRGGGRLHSLLASTSRYMLQRARVTVFVAHPAAPGDPVAS